MAATSFHVVLGLHVSLLIEQEPRSNLRMIKENVFPFILMYDDINVILQRRLEVRGNRFYCICHFYTSNIRKTGILNILQ